MEFIENFKSKYENFYKKSREVTKTRECIVENIQNTRRTTRAQFLTDRRNISEVLSPCPSPVLMVSAAKKQQPKKQQPKKSPSKKMDRLQRLKLWKEEKMKLKEEQKSKMKPLFKVGAKANVGFPNVAGDSKKVVKKSFAPSNYIFKAPSNVKAIELNAVKKAMDVYKRITRSQKSIASSPVALPTRTRKKQVIVDPKKDETNNNKRNKITRQNAFDSVLQDTNNKVKEQSTTRKIITESETKKGNKENISSNVENNKSKRRSLRLNNDNNIEKVPEKIIPSEENSKKKKTPKRKSMQKNNETSNKRQSKRKSFRKSTSNADNLNNTYEFINPDDQTTPIKDDVFSPVAAYISPFVTTSRGKGSIRKENKERSIRGLPSFTEFITPDQELNNSFQITGASYFHTVLNNEISRLTSMCETWNTYKDATPTLTEDAKDLIDVAVGQANLLMTKKFQQFRKLINTCENGHGEDQRVTCEDLQGFWDMVYIQVENLNTRFNRLNELKNHNWEEINPIVQQKIVKKGGIKKRIRSAVTSSLRATIEAARKKSKSASSVDTVFNGGFFVVKSPQKKSHTPEKIKTPAKDRRSLLKSVLSSETRKSCRKSVASPGVNMMKASQTAKSIENLNFTMPTPGKSILKKTSKRKSIANTSSKAVLFKDYDSDSDN